MKEYPSICGTKYLSKFLGKPCLAFYKYDGSNLRFEWNRKSGWYKFGSRHRLLDKDSEFASAIPIFREQFADALEKNFRDRKVDQATAYLEFFGPHSFAGQHDIATLNFLGFDVQHNDPKELVLLDVGIHKKGMVSSREFVDVYGHLKIAQVVHEGILTTDFVQEVRSGELPVWEGVICKGGERHDMWMLKIKTEKYRDELVKRYAGVWGKYWE